MSLQNNYIWLHLIQVHFLPLPPPPLPPQDYNWLQGNSWGNLKKHSGGWVEHAVCFTLIQLSILCKKGLEVILLYFCLNTPLNAICLEERLSVYMMSQHQLKTLSYTMMVPISLKNEKNYFQTHWCDSNWVNSVLLTAYPFALALHLWQTFQPNKK